MTPEEAKTRYLAEWPALNAEKERAQAAGDIKAARKARQQLSFLSQECAARHAQTHKSAEFTLTVKVRAAISPERYEAAGLAVIRHAESLAWAIRDAPELRGRGVEVSVLPLTVSRP